MAGCHVTYTRERYVIQSSSYAALIGGGSEYRLESFKSNPGEVRDAVDNKTVCSIGFEGYARRQVNGVATAATVDGRGNYRAVLEANKLHGLAGNAIVLDAEYSV